MAIFIFYGKVLMWPIYPQVIPVLAWFNIEEKQWPSFPIIQFSCLSRVLRIIFCRSDTTRPVSGDITEAVIDNSARQRLRTSSFGTRKMSSKQAVVIDNSINNATR